MKPLSWKTGVARRHGNVPVWPTNYMCYVCGAVIKSKAEYLATVHNNSMETIAFHRHCIVSLVNDNFPESLWTEIRNQIIAANGDPFGLEATSV